MGCTGVLWLSESAFAINVRKREFSVHLMLVSVVLIILRHPRGESTRDQKNMRCVVATACVG